jgi:hypothetical protein
MTTEQVLMEAERTLATVRSDEVINVVVLVCGFAVLALVLEYVYRRWTWIPRRRQRRSFIERF